MGNIGLRLIIIVIANKILDGVVREEGFEFIEKLRSQGFVVCDHQGRSLQFTDDIGHGESLARTGDAQQNLVFLFFFNTFDQFTDCMGLIASRAVIRFEKKRNVLLHF